jgi:hypothetical protein
MNKYFSDCVAKAGHMHNRSRFTFNNVYGPGADIWFVVN